MLNELGGDGYLHLDHGRLGPNASSGFVNVRFQDKGRATIEQLPDPNQELVMRLDRIAAVIEGLQDIDPEEKTRAQQAVGELKTFGRNVSPAAAMEVVKAAFRDDLILDIRMRSGPHALAGYLRLMLQNVTAVILIT